MVTGTIMTNVAGLLTATSPKMPRHIKPVCKRKKKPDHNQQQLVNYDNCRIYSNKHPGAYLRIRLNGEALIRRRRLIGEAAYQVRGAITRKEKEQFLYVKELCKHMEKEITGTDKKLFSCADSAVIKAYKVLN